MTNPQDTISTYAANALLTTLRKSEWTGKIKASELDGEIAIANNATKGKATKTDKFLIAQDEPLWKAVKKAGRDLHTTWETWSTPWQDGGTRMIASSAFLDFSQRLEAKTEAFKAAVAAFVADYEAMIPRQATRLGDLFDPSNYPTKEQIAEKFGVAIDYLPVPTAGDFRVQLADDQMAAVQASTERMVEAALKKAALDPVKRLHKAVSKVVATLAQPNAIFRDSMIGNIRELAAMMPALNIANDPKLDALTDEIQQDLASIDPTELRDPKWRQGGHAGHDRSQAAQDKRQEAKSKAEAILAKMGDLML